MSAPLALHLGDCLEVLRTLPDASVDAVVTDPPYGLAFMGKRWDYDVPTVEVWAECLRVLKPGGHLLAFAGTRTQHRMAVRVEDAGFEIRDMIAWIYGSGFPKSLDVSKAIDKRGGASVAWFGPWFRKWREDNGVTQKQVAALFPSKTGGLTGCVANWELGFNMPTPEQFNLIRDTFGLPFSSVEEAEREVVGHKKTGDPVAWYAEAQRGNGIVAITAPATPAARQWHGWGTALKPALEPITVARKPLCGTVAENVLAHGAGGINVDGCRIDAEPRSFSGTPNRHGGQLAGGGAQGEMRPDWHETRGRWPANLIHDGSDEVVGLFPETTSGSGNKSHPESNRYGGNALRSTPTLGDGKQWQGDTGSAARFFYTAKASRDDRSDGNTHPTVKPTDLMRYLCRLVTPPGGIVLDPFMGSGSTGKAAMLEGFGFIGIEREAAYHAIAERRISQAAAAGHQPSLFN